MASSTGLLTQSIQNLLTAGKNLASINGLPSNAQTISASAISLLQGEITKITATQAAVKQFVAATLPRLQQVQNDLNTNTNLSQDITIVTELGTNAVALQQNVNALNTDINATKASLVNLYNGLSPIKIELNGRQISLNTQLQSAQQEADAIRSKEKYFLLLGIFGLIGLAAAAIALAVEQGKVNDLQAQASSLRAQMTTLGNMINSVNSMNADFTDIITKISNVKNAVDFVASDATVVLNDLKNSNGEQTQAKLYVATTITQLQTVASDAA